MSYTLQEENYFIALNLLAEGFERQGIQYALVGGAGVQARISDIFCRAQNTDITNAIGLEFLLRGTKDFDITSNASEEDFITCFNEMQASNPHLEIYPEKIRGRRMAIRGRRKEANVFVNYQTGPQDLFGLDELFYNSCIETAERVNLSYSNQTSPIYVATPESLITSKLTRKDPKDIWDIGALLKTIRKYSKHAGEFKESEVVEHLERSGKEEMVGRLEEIKKQILKE